MRRLAVFMLSLLLSSVSFAQDANPFNGNWKVTLTLPNGRNFSDIDLLVDGTGGSWQSKAINRDNRCMGLKYPIEVTHSNASELKFTILADKTLKGCPDGRFEFQLVDGKLVGQVVAVDGPQLGAKAVAER
jgi:hypothetical protein